MLRTINTLVANDLGPRSILRPVEYNIAAMVPAGTPINLRRNLMMIRTPPATAHGRLNSRRRHLLLIPLLIEHDKACV